ncbi:MAG: DNA replication/repair protein RecF [Propionibacteriaceae bacterium]|nr:DNA replication/repair protein RecF [Propionibacteriaceae bacterium]
MYITDVELVDFRNYEQANLEFAPGVNVLTGQNGQGKTNIVEAVAYLATMTSHRVSLDAPLVRRGAERAVVRARVVAGLNDRRVLTLELEINPGAANRAQLNRAPQRRARDLLGALRVVAFTPDDLGLVQGDPAQRRDAVDDVVVTRWPRLAGVKADYDKVIRQRNALLKTAAARGRLDTEAAATLDVWDAQLASFGSEIVLARAATITDLAPHLMASYQAIAPANDAAMAVYAPRQETLRGYLRGDDSPTSVDIAALLRESLAERRADEVRRGISLVGPHRDEIELSIGELPAKGYASHGEAWSLALAWRLAAFNLLRAEGIEPVLLLDDVFAELDTTRRARLADEVVAAEQTIITAAVREDVPPSLSGHNFLVQAGSVKEV